MDAEIVERGRVRNPIDDNVVGGLREQRLATVAEVADAGGAIDRGADVVALVPQLDLARVDPYAQADRVRVRALKVQCGRHGVRGASEGYDKAVALALFDGADTAVGVDDLVDDLV